MCIAAAIAGGAILGAGASIYAGNKAASAQESAASNANSTQLSMYNQTRADQAPWRAAGGNAVGALNNWYGLPGSGSNGAPSAATQAQTIQNTPGYQFNLAQGNLGVQRNLASQGLLNSGAAGKAIAQYNQGLASNYQQNYVGGLQSLAGLGIQSNAQTTASGMNAANQVGSGYAYGGNAAAAGYMNQAAALNYGLGGLNNNASALQSAYQANNFTPNGAYTDYNSAVNSQWGLPGGAGYLGGP